MNDTKTQQMDTQEQDRLHKFEEGSVLSVLLKTALPIVILMVFNSAYMFVDSLMSSNYVIYSSADQLTGGTSIGLIFPLMGILTSFEIMIAVGCGLAYAQALAKKDNNKAKIIHQESFSMIIYMGIFIFVFIAIIGIPYILTISGNWGSNPTWGAYRNQMVRDAYIYMLILGLAFIPMYINESYIRVLRAEGKGNIAALIPILTFPINIFCDWLFMSPQAGIQLNLAGAGLATLIATSFGTLLMLTYVYLMGRKDVLIIKMRRPRLFIQREIAVLVLMFAMGSLLRRLFDNGTVIVLSNYVGNIFTDSETITRSIWQSSWTVMTRSINMGSMIALGVAQSVSMLTSYFYGKSDYGRLKDTIKYGAISMLVCTLASSLVLFELQGILYNAYDPSGNSFYWEFGNQLFIAFTLALIYSIPLSLQPLAVMLYAGVKRPKLTFIHSLVFNLIIIAFVSIGFLINVFTKQPLMLFVMMVLGAFVALVVVGFFFKKNYYKLVTLGEQEALQLQN